MKLLDLLWGEKAPTAVALWEALAQAEADRDAAAQKLDRLQARRAELLLDGDGESLDVLERDLTRAQRHADRLDLVIVQAQEHLAEGGDPRRLPDPDELARPGEPDDLRWSATSMRQRFWDQIALPSSDECYRLMPPPTNAFGRPLRPDEGRPDR